MKVAVAPLYDTLPLILLAPLFTVNVEVVMVDEFIDSLKVAVTVLAKAAPVAPAAGLLEIIAGAVVSRVMESLAALDTFPATSLNHTYTVLAPSPLLMVNGTFAL